MSLLKRERILSRLEAIGLTIPSFETYARNRGLMDNDQRPVWILLDGDERTKLGGTGRGRRQMSPVLVTMRPQIWVSVKTRKPLNKEIGQELNLHRVNIISAIANDAVLLTEITPNGDIGYEGFETDLKSGSTLDGTMRLDFAITYPMDPYTTT